MRQKERKKKWHLYVALTWAVLTVPLRKQKLKIWKTSYTLLLPQSLRTTQESYILKQEKINLPLTPTVISGLRMKRLCCSPWIQKNCHNPRKKEKQKINKSKQPSLYLVLLTKTLCQ